MSRLPVKPLPRDEVTIGGETVEFRSMSRAEALQMAEFAGREDEAELFILMCGTGCTKEEAAEFREQNDTDTAGLLIDGILVLSGLAKKPLVVAPAPAIGRGADADAPKGATRSRSPRGS